MRAFFMRSTFCSCGSAQHGSHPLEHTCFTRIDVSPQRIRLSNHRRTVRCVLQVLQVDTGIQDGTFDTRSEWSWPLPLHP